MLTDIVLVLIILVIATSSALYLYRAKKRGVHCVGCPHAKACGGKKCNCDSGKNK